ncbi:hypothetical protein VB776_20350 [Arcicella sp. DC2W]|uniref:PKD domain-containing protein n=1 Tax=Arcicella gelida TaxID=2984195 RepID=A0ABU5SA58_9BACT|nr:hypothetical protein [Arcicella sp. DC2W]MEA5405300.1 hypothetical protein [Arcicella sp. DC2W]
MKTSKTPIFYFLVSFFIFSCSPKSNLEPEPVEIIETAKISFTLDTLGKVQFYFKPTSTNTFKVDFGDSTKTTLIESTFSHKYENAGIYPIIIKNTTNKIIALDTLIIPFISKPYNFSQTKFNCGENILSFEDNLNNIGCLPQGEQSFRYTKENSILIYYVKQNPYVNIVFEIKSFTSNGSYLIDKRKKVEGYYLSEINKFGNGQGYCNLFFDNSSKKFTGDYKMDLMSNTTKKKVIVMGNFKNMKSEKFNFFY